jgi:hypothetical protein
MAMTGDQFIKVGFWSQLVLLFLVDWGTLAAFARGGVPWYHYVGFVIVNVFLLWLTFVLWLWLRDKKGEPLNHEKDLFKPDEPAPDADEAATTSVE